MDTRLEMLYSRFSGMHWQPWGGAHDRANVGISGWDSCVVCSAWHVGEPGLRGLLHCPGYECAATPLISRIQEWILRDATVSLVAWHSRLLDRFTQLRATRPQGWPIFAFEHGLDETDRSKLFAAIREDACRSLTSPNAWLAYVAYAAEFGYRFDGKRFWPAFEAETAGWSLRGDRYRLPALFQRFRDEFGGAPVDEAFADYRSIICWPITHAVLPRNLQVKVARALDRLTPRFTADILSSPEALGRLIATLQGEPLLASLHFRAFCAQPALAGVVAQALLLQGTSIKEELIEPKTLSRIVADLEKVQDAKEWLKRARSRVRKIHGIRVRPVTEPNNHQVSASAEVLERFSAAAESEDWPHPRFFLVPSRAHGWDVKLELPDLTILADRHPRIREFLAKATLTIPAADNRRETGTWLLWRPAPISLTKWPRGGARLLDVNPVPPDVLKAYLHLRARADDRPLRLFRVQDRIAVEVAGLLVRPGSRYVIASTSPLHQGPWSPVQTTCAGLHLAELTLPAPATPQDRDACRAIGLQIGEEIRLWPVGLPPAKWDGQGAVQWTLNDLRHLAIRMDFPVSGVRLHLPATESRVYRDVPAEEPLLIDLNHLGVGTHTVKVELRPIATNVWHPAGDVAITIRPARIWSPAQLPSAVQTQLPPKPAPQLPLRLTGQLSPPQPKVYARIVLSRTHMPHHCRMDWRIVWAPAKTTVRLVTTCPGREITVVRYVARRPTHVERITAEAAKVGISIVEPALFVARHNARIATHLVLPGDNSTQRERSAQVEPCPEPLQRLTFTGFDAQLTFIERWWSAPPVDEPAAEALRRRVVRILLASLAAAIGRDVPIAAHVLERLDEAVFPLDLTPMDRVHSLKASVAGLDGPILQRREGGFTDLALAEFALRLASAPYTLRAKSVPWLRAGFSDIICRPSLLRAARHLVVKVDAAHAVRELPPPGSLYAGWDWSQSVGAAERP